MVKEKSQYKSLAEWRKTNPNDYAKVNREGWLDEICDIFGWVKPQIKPNGYWTKERVMAEAKKFNARTEWMIGSSSSYSSARRNGWVDDASRHMKDVKVVKPKGYWDIKENCIAEAKKHKSITEWQNKSSQSVIFARRNGWMDECTEHMIETRKPRGYWDIKENCITEAKKHRTITEWQNKSSQSVKGARRNGWMDECTKHMDSLKKPKGYWDIKENCITEAKKHRTITEWKATSSPSVKGARRNGWMDECTEHME